jgi:hypothetical protein
MSSNTTDLALPQPTRPNDIIDNRQIGEDQGAKDGDDLDESSSEAEDHWWRTFKLWKVNMRGLSDDNTS